VRAAGIARKVCRVMFGKDGSYYVTTPYHRDRAATLMKMTVDYDAGSTFVGVSQDVVDIAELDEKRVKLSHHRSGLCQFSGDGVVSGVDADGNIKGIGVFTSPLEQVGCGPAFAICIYNHEELEEVAVRDVPAVVIDESQIGNADQGRGGVLSVEGHYFQPEMRRFIVERPTGRVVQYVHPWRMCVLEMPVILAPDACDYPGFIAIDMHRWTVDSKNTGFTMSGPSENVRIDQYGHRRGDSIMCAYPKWDALTHRRSVRFENPPPPSGEGFLRKGHPGA
jgi:hypothetical protein